jgi:D-alanyl-D-alanine carboxypeptidase/D-alanyl-D-alanine-endopeptidase (penicillin-binding protein 4)
MRVVCERQTIMDSMPLSITENPAEIDGRVSRRRWLASVCALTACASVGAAPEARVGTKGESHPAGTKRDAPVASWAAMTGASPALFGVAARPVGGGPALVDWNGDAALNPASAMKVVTTYAGLALLGPQYRWTTTLHLDGVMRGGVLYGNLVLHGGGDPKFVIEDLRALIARMRAEGLAEIRGDLVIDDSMFDLRGASLESLDGEPWQPYNVAPHAALMNFKATRIVVRNAGGQPRISLDPPLADVRLRNELKPVAGQCGQVASALWVRDHEGAKGQPEIRVGGRFAPGCGESSVYAAVLDHRSFIHGFFKAAWRATGGRLDGSTRIETGAAVSPVWLRWESPRNLLEIIHDINKFSNNVMTRQLMLTIAAHGQSRAGTPELARQRVAQWLASQGLKLPELVIDNGSGLSRTERISAAGLSDLLVHASRSPLGAALRESLPRVGFDGTMRGRLGRHPVAGRAWIKTGSLRDVRSIAGYVDAASGRRYAVTMLANGERLLGAQPAQDAFLRWVYERG